MRILLLTPDFPPARGGVQNLLERLASALSTRHDVEVLTQSQAGARAWDRTRPYRTRRVWSRPFRVPALGLLAARTLLETIRLRPDVIICGHILLGPICALVRRLVGVPYVAIGHGSELRSSRMRRIAGIGLRNAAVTFTGSDFARQAILGHGVPPDRVRLLRPGPGIELGGSDDPPPVRGDGTCLLSVSRLVERYKGHDMVIRALPLIRAKIPGVRYVIVGDGWLRSYLERIAESIGVRDAVTFTGELTDDEVETWYRRCDAFVLMSRESEVGGGAEGYGLVFIEANLRGKPVIAGRSGGIPDAVLDGVTGLLVNPRKIGEIADAAVRVLSDHELAARLGAQGRRRAIDELSWSRYLVEFEGVLTSLA
jgi:phosphatidylinositol alpha-1,6-mannosyltransferase